MAFELMTGKRRLADKPGVEAIEYLIKTKFEIPKISLTGIPRKYSTIILKALAPKPANRYQTAEEMTEAFKKTESEFIGSVPLRKELHSGINIKSIAAKILSADKTSSNFFFITIKRISLVLVISLMIAAIVYYFSK